MRREFSKAVMRDAAARAGGRCENPNCGARLALGDFHYDHIIPDALGGEPTLDNCQVICRACHKEKTGKADIPRIAKTKRISDREKGIRKPRTIIRWRRFDGSVVEAGRQR
jgi:5-methylcytosine-specific restriction endonuclease McrA